MIPTQVEVRNKNRLKEKWMDMYNGPNFSIQVILKIIR